MTAPSQTQSSGPSDPGDQKITVSLSPNEAREFAEKLAEDEKFRDRLRADPRGVLAEWGIDWLDAWPDQLDLPPRDEIRSMIKAVDEETPFKVRPGTGGLGVLSATFFCYCYFSMCVTSGD